MFAYSFMDGWKLTARASVRLGCATAVLGLGACDPQASPLFQGEALFTLHGSVSIAEEHTEGELSPALAFVNQDAGKIELVDVEVRGTFPADFRIDVFAPPSEHAFVQLRDYGAQEPRLALGYITAVTADHPDSFSFANFSSSEARPSSCGAGCTLECDPVRGCATTQEWCTNEDRQQCYRETTSCPAPDSPPEDCRVEREGDASIKEPVLAHFAGLSQNFMVAYLADAAAAGSGTAAYLGAPRGLARGYHLLRVMELSEQDTTSWKGCVARSDALGLDAYNAEHHTHYTQRDLDIRACGLTCLAGSPGCDVETATAGANCELSEPEYEAFVAEVRRLQLQAQLENGCAQSPLTAVEDLASTAIAIQLSTDVRPGF